MAIPPTDPSQSGLKWAFRICITLFLLPFFGAGLFLIAGGGFAGSQGGLFTGLGVFGVLIGLAFLAVPTLMMILVWTSSFKGPAAESQARFEPKSTKVVDTTAMQTCSYCSLARPMTEAACQACGARHAARAVEQ